MTTANFKTGHIIEVEGLKYEIIEIKVTADHYPNTKRACPHIEKSIAVKGKRGAMRGGYITTDGKIFLYK